MPDINLLKDTREPEDRYRRKPVVPAKIEMTRPPKEKKEEEKKAKTASSIGMFFKSLFSPQPKRKKTDEKLTAQAAEAKLNGTPIKEEGRVITIPPITARPKNEPEDIFEAQADKGVIEKKEVQDIRDILTEEETMPKIIERKARPEFKEKEAAENRDKKCGKTPPVKPESSFLVNLLPEELADKSEPRQKLINLIIITFSAVILIGLVYIGMILYQSRILSKTSDIKTQRSEVELKISNYRDIQKAAIDLKQETDTVKNLLASHVYWTKFFEKLEKYIIDDVYLTGTFTGNTTGQITLSAIGKDFESVAKQLVVLKNAPDFAKSVDITSASKTGEGLTAAPGAVVSEGVSFNINLVLADDLFYKTESERLDQNQNLNSNLNLNVNNNTNSGQ